MDDWSVEMVNFISENIVRAKSYSFLCKDLNTKFGCNFTRNSVISKVRRLGLHGKLPSKIKKVKPSVPLIPCKPSVHQRYSHRRPSDNEVGRIDIDDFEVTHRPKNSSSSCQWPTDAGPCGDQIAVGSYCLKHAKKAYTVMPTVARNEVLQLRIAHELTSSGMDDD